MESEWRDALNDGYVVKVNIIPKYKNKSLRLISYTVKYEIDGVKYIKNIKNA